MAVYTDISDTELEAFLADYDLGAPTSFKGIAEGVENSNFLLETEAGRYVLTIYERRVRADQLPFFLGLMEWLAARGFPSAPPIADHEGRRLRSVRGKPAALSAFLPGLAVRRPTLVHCREAGEGLAWLHLAARGFPGRRVNDLGWRAWAGLFAGLATQAEALKPGLAATIEADLALFARSWPAGLPEGIIHADYFPDNVFFADGRFAGAIDFYFAAWDTLAYDIAVALNAWCFQAGGAFDVAAAGAFVEGYRRRRPLAAEEAAALPLLAHGAAMRFFLTRLNDWTGAPPGALVRPKDPLEYERKLAAHRSGAAAGAWALPEAPA
ncbi:MAG: homoserine kinase [Caulobacteraceae bacterium]|nr:homoserine kinase [Caulobacteraceae bacterium]